MQEGLIFDIERFAIHDGPGIRTLVFMKGCPLRCLWCDNPESQKVSPELALFVGKCIGCGKCLEVCAEGAIYKYGDELRFDWERCTNCGKCAEVCPSEAKKLIGKRVTVEWLVDEIMKDLVFYQKSGGGVTIGGGEPLLQFEFVRQVLEECRKRGISTAIETCGHGEWNQVEKVLDYTDLVLFDIKHMDAKRHRALTGISNDLILENARKISSNGSPKIMIRIPVIPTLNDSEENIVDVARFVSRLGNIEEVNLLPYHRLGESKYEQLGREYKLKDLEPLDENGVQGFKEILESYGLKVQVGG